MSDDSYRRRSARVLLLDEGDRLLMFRLLHDRRCPERGHFWITPGGGVDKGETLPEAAARELREETGLRIAPAALGRTVAMASGHADLSWASGLFRDDFFFHRVTAHEVDPGGMEPHELAHVTGHQWWTVDGLAATTEEVYPLGLVPLLTDLIAGRVPDEPIRLPWQH